MKENSGKRCSRLLAVFMTVFMLMGMMPQAAFADDVEKQQVRVVVENTVWTEADGAPWSGTLADQWVDIDADTTMISALNDVLESKGQAKATESAGELTQVKGIANADAGADCKWTASINGSVINAKFADYSIANGNIKNGDVIRIYYDGTVTAGNSEEGDSDEEEASQNTPAENAAAVNVGKSDDVRKAARTAKGSSKIDATNGVRVIVENTVYSVKAGAKWDGTLVDTWVKLEDDSTMMGCVVEALDTVEATQTGAESNYISEINGLSAGSAGGYDGWMGTLNDWFTSNGFGDYTVEAGTLEAGDEIRIMYSLTMGEDIGGSWYNNDKSVKSIEFSKGELDKAFNKDSHEYVLTVPYGTENIKVTPTATNKNFIVKTFVDNKEYKRTADIPVKEGTVIKVKCGDPEWPSMNGGGSIPAEEYTITVHVAEDMRTPADLTSLIIHTGYSPSSSTVLLRNADDSYSTSNIFSADKTEYDLGTVTDAVNQLRFRPGATDAVVTLYYEGGNKVITWKGGNSSSTWANCLKPGKNTLKMVVTPNDTTEKKEATYFFYMNVTPTLTALSASTGDAPLYLDKTFSATANEYTLAVPENTETVDFAVTPTKSSYKVTYNGSEESSVNIKDKTSVEISVTAGEGEAALTNKYTVNLNKVKTLGTSFQVTPEDAVVKVYDKNGISIEADENGVFSGMFSAQEYTYTVTKYGYIASTGTVPKTGGLIKVDLQKAPDSKLNDVESDWKNFRGNDENMGITDAETPISVEDTAKLWNAKLGSGWNAAPSVQIIVDDALIVMCGNKNIYKLDLKTGEILKQGTMTAAPNFGYTPPVYAEGMIFCPLSGGTVQAFNAETLESLWIYKDTSGGQALSPITYSDGYIYTGFWNSEVKSANYVCISVTDEDPAKTDEPKVAAWKKSQAGGFYWAGSVVVGDAVIVGTDDGASGTSGTSQLYALDKLTGKVISCIDMTGVGDQRSSMAYDKQSGRVFFTTKGGYLCSAAVDAKTGAVTDLKTANNKAQSTSTPIVYKGKVYYATGSGISSTGSSGNIVVADANSLEMLYAVGLKGYPQCSLLLSTAYEEETGYIYLYSTYNNKPGGISMLKVKPEATTAAETELIELYDAEGFEQYCITSIICGKDGTLYYKNDSGNVFAVGIPDATAVKNLINKIGDPEDITLESKYDIEDAREAYDALSEEDKAKVPNYDKLVAAEEALYELEIENAETLIAKIGDVTLTSEEAIKAAREVYDSLSDKQKDEVKNYSELTAAEAKLAKLKKEQEEALKSASTAVTSAATKSVKVTLSGNVKEAQNKIDQALALELPENLADITKEQLTVIYEAYTEYELLSKAQKSKLKNEDEFTKLLDNIGAAMHQDKDSGITAEGIAWNYKINVKPMDITDEDKAAIEKTLGEDAELLVFYDIDFIDAVTGTEYNPENAVKVKIPVPDMKDFKTPVIVHVNDDGVYEYIKCELEGDYLVFEAQSFSPYGVAGTDLSWDDIMDNEESGSGYWMWIIIAAIALAAVVYIAYRKKHTA